ncbi:hypothetical protein [Candidatus Williamhamiltonella defendens]|uniref:hypothetical protein n=1 Tax=Candidatus Williamhamiltonella defendens TaxID=138072 RepID=UPI00130E5F41|nr:hypothetical protein [Candidatus Hamiltonella defensa]
MDAAAISAKVAQKSAENTAMVSIDAAKASAGTAASQASIPYVGPVLVVAAMMRLLGNVKKVASDGLVTGQGTFTSNSILARLSADQFVMNVAAVKQVGVDFMK